MKRRKIIIGLASVLTLTVVGTLLYYNKATPESMAIADDMEEVGDGYRFTGSGATGFIIFAGAKADEKGYAYMAKLLKDAGHTVVIPKMPVHLSITGVRRGLKAMEDNPDVDKWVLIGHSLGGLPISQIAAKEPPALEGIVYLASYLVVDLSHLDISALRITANRDQIMSRDRLNANLSYLPARSKSVEIEGNHQGFGAYESLRSDGETTATWQEQQEETVKLITEFFGNK